MSELWTTVYRKSLSSVASALEAVRTAKPATRVGHCLFPRRQHRLRFLSNHLMCQHGKSWRRHCQHALESFLKCECVVQGVQHHHGSQLLRHSASSDHRIFQILPMLEGVARAHSRSDAQSDARADLGGDRRTAHDLSASSHYGLRGRLDCHVHASVRALGVKDFVQLSLPDASMLVASDTGSQQRLGFAMASSSRMNAGFNGSTDCIRVFCSATQRIELGTSSTRALVECSRKRRSLLTRHSGASIGHTGTERGQWRSPNRYDKSSRLAADDRFLLPLRGKLERLARRAEALLVGKL